MISVCDCSELPLPPILLKTLHPYLMGQFCGKMLCLLRVAAGYRASNVPRKNNVLDFEGAERRGGFSTAIRPHGPAAGTSNPCLVC